MTTAGSLRRDELRALLGGNDSTQAVLRAVCGLCVSELAVTGAGVRVIDVGSATEVGALVCVTDDLGARLDDLAAVAGEGPGIDAVTLGRPVLVPDLSKDGMRWPGYTPEAISAGVAAVFAFPLQIGAARVGALELHRITPGSLTADRLTDALLLADIAVDTILHDLHGVTPLTLPELADIHAEVHQATGMVSVELDVSLPEALARLRGYAFAHQMTLAEAAGHIIMRRLRLDTEE